MRLAIAFLAGALSSASGAIGLVAHTGSLTTAGANSAVTATINTTGATLLTVAVATYSQSAAGVALTDSNGNTWHALTDQNPLPYSNQSHSNIWYAYDRGGTPLVVGSGHSVTINCSGCYAGMNFSAWSGTLTGSDPFDGTQNGGGTVGPSFSVPPITPSLAGELAITSFCDVPGSSYAIGGPFTMIDASNYDGSVTMGDASAYLIQGAAASAGPTWTVGSGGSDPIAASIAAFRAAVGNSTSMPVVW